MSWKESGESGETERRMRRAFADHADGVLKSPVGMRREELHQEHVDARDNAHRQVMEWSRSVPECRCPDASRVRAAARILARGGRALSPSGRHGQPGVPLVREPPDDAPPD